MPAPLTHAPFSEADEAIRRKALTLRAKLGMTVREFAANMGAKLPTVAHYERGTLRWPVRYHALIERDLAKLK